MPSGGRRPGAGRPKGSVSKKTEVRLRMAEEAAALGITPLAVMLTTMRALWDKGTEEDQLAACRIADLCAPYVHPRLASVEQRMTVENFSEMTDDELAKIAASGAGATEAESDPSQLH